KEVELTAVYVRLHVVAAVHEPERVEGRRGGDRLQRAGRPVPVLEEIPVVVVAEPVERYGAARRARPPSQREERQVRHHRRDRRHEERRIAGGELRAVPRRDDERRVLLGRIGLDVRVELGDGRIARVLRGHAAPRAERRRGGRLVVELDEYVGRGRQAVAGDA